MPYLYSLFILLNGERNRSCQTVAQITLVLLNSVIKENYPIPLILERAKRIELSASAWKAEVLPLYDTRIGGPDGNWTRVLTCQPISSTFYLIWHYTTVSLMSNVHCCAWVWFLMKLYTHGLHQPSYDPTYLILDISGEESSGTKLVTESHSLWFYEETAEEGFDFWKNAFGTYRFLVIR